MNGQGEFRAPVAAPSPAIAGQLEYRLRAEMDSLTTIVTFQTGAEQARFTIISFRATVMTWDKQAPHFLQTACMDRLDCRFAWGRRDSLLSPCPHFTRVCALDRLHEAPHLFSHDIQ